MLHLFVRCPLSLNQQLTYVKGYRNSSSDFCQFCYFSLLLFCKVILRCTHIKQCCLLSLSLSFFIVGPLMVYIIEVLLRRVLLNRVPGLHNKATRPSPFLSLSLGDERFLLWLTVVSTHGDSLKNCVFVKHFDVDFWFFFICDCKIPSDLSNPLVKNNWSHPPIQFFRSFQSVSIYPFGNQIGWIYNVHVYYSIVVLWYVSFRNGIKKIYRIMDLFGKICFLFCKCTPGLPFGSVRSGMKY